MAYVSLFCYNITEKDSREYFHRQNATLNILIRGAKGFYRKK